MPAMLYFNKDESDEGVGDDMINDESCLILIKWLETNVGKRMNNEMKGADMTGTQVRTLSILLESPEKQATLKYLENKLKLAQSVTAGIIKRLEQKRYIESFGDLEDKRIKIVRITPLGERQYWDSQIILSKLEKDIFSCLTESEYRTFGILLKKVKKSMEDSK